MSKAKLFALKQLSKSGILSLVLISVLGGYIIGYPPELPFDWKRLYITLFCLLFLAAGSSALNQLQEYRQDSLMPRTSKRPIPQGILSRKEVSFFIILTIISGLSGIAFFLNKTVLTLGLVTLLTYNGFYTLWWKRRWAYAAIPGAIPGALPILMGYAAASGTVKPQGWYLFFILFFWQMPHFWTLAIQYQEDYALAGFPTLPVRYGYPATIRQITIWCLCYLLLVFLAPLFFPLGLIFWILSLFCSVKVLYELCRYISQKKPTRWLPFFLWITWSLLFFLASIALDLWITHFY